MEGLPQLPLSWGDNGRWAHLGFLGFLHTLLVLPSQRMQLEERLGEHLSTQYGACQAWHGEGVGEPLGWHRLGQELPSNELFASHRWCLIFRGATFRETRISRARWEPQESTHLQLSPLALTWQRPVSLRGHPFTGWALQPAQVWSQPLIITPMAWPAV